MTYYLGTLGALTALPDPEVGLPLTVERIGGSHQLLSGAKVRDTIGYSRSWQLSWTAITLAQYGLLEGFYYGFTGAGPFYLMDPEQTNRLPLNVSTGTDTTGDATGFTAGTHSSVFSSTNANANFNSIGGPFPANGGHTLGIGITTSVVAFEAVATVVKTVPVVAGGTYTFSIYANVPAAATFAVAPRIAWYDSSNAFISFSTHTSVAANTSARAAADGATAPSNAATAQLLVVPTATNTSGATQFVYTDGYQFEQAPLPSTWQPGVPMPLVTVESLSRSTPLAGICDAQMTLVQVG